MKSILPKDIERALSPDSSVIDSKFRENLKKKLISGDNMATTNQKSSIFSIKNLVPLVGASLVLAGLAGVGSYMFSSNKSEQAALRAVELPADLSDLKPLDEIRSIAQIGLIGDLTITSVELEQEEGVLVYKVRFSDGTFKLFNAKTAEMIVKSDLEIDESVPVGFVAGVTIDGARAAAQAVYPGKVITNIELEMEEGVVVYSVKFSDDSRVDVSALDGSVVRSRDGASSSSSGSNNDSDDSVDSSDHEEEDIEDDGDRSGSKSGRSGGDDNSKDDTQDGSKDN